MCGASTTHDPDVVTLTLGQTHLLPSLFLTGLIGVIDQWMGFNREVNEGNRGECMGREEGLYALRMVSNGQTEVVVLRGGRGGAKGHLREE